MIGTSANEAAEALFEFDDGFWELVVAERVAAFFADCVEASFEEGVVGDGERQLGDDHGLQRVARHVDALPEAVGAQQHRPRILFELVEHLRPRGAVGLAQESQVARDEPGRERGRHPSQHVVAGEEHERAAVGPAGVLLD